jgi:hypothetical protein
MKVTDKKTRLKHAITGLAVLAIGALAVPQGMLLDLGYEDGITPVLAVPERPVPNGTRAG